MGLQDKIFDITAALEGRPECEAFEEVVALLGAYESAYDELLTWAMAIERGAHFQRRLENGDARQLLELAAMSNIKRGGGE